MLFFVFFVCTFLSIRKHVNECFVALLYFLMHFNYKCVGLFEQILVYVDDANDVWFSDERPAAVGCLSVRPTWSGGVSFVRSIVYGIGW